MAKLETTADNLQWKSKMLTTAQITENAAAWDSDDLYPSAAAVKDAITRSIGGGGAVCDVTNPVGSVIITSTNTNPGLSLGGTWELFDKE